MALKEQSFTGWRDKWENTGKEQDREREKKKRYNIQVWGPQCANWWTICGKASEAVFPLNVGKKREIEPVYSAGNHTQSGVLTRAMRM